LQDGGHEALIPAPRAHDAQQGTAGPAG
jgi:iron complex transport system ATP-binding protein